MPDRIKEVHHRFAVQLSWTLGFGMTAVYGLLIVHRVIFSDPVSTLAAAGRDVVSMIGLGTDGMLWSAGLSLALVAGLIGLANLKRWGYALVAGILGGLSVLTLNPFACSGVIVLLRAEPTLFRMMPLRPRPPAEWRHLLFSGALAAVVFGPQLFAWSPASQVERLRVSPPPPRQRSALSSLASTDTQRDEALLRLARSFAIALEFQPQRGLTRFPVSRVPTPLMESGQQWPASVQPLLRDDLGQDVWYWSDGTQFAFYAALSTAFVRPGRFAVAPPPETVLIRLSGDPRDDLDFDGLADQHEARIGTSPVLADTDGDGLSDGSELGSNRNPRLRDE